MLMLGLLSAVSYASECPNLYPKDFPKVNGKELCSSFYVVLYDEGKQRPIVSVERLDIGPIGGFGRLSAFRVDTRIKHPSNPLPFYTNSGYDKGHLTPADDSPTKDGMKETFLDTNITPQAPDLNRGPWRILESKVRKNVHSETFVLNIPVYQNSPEYLGPSPIPSGYWKVVLPAGDAYYTDNKNTGKVKSYKFDWKKYLSNQ